MSFMSDDDLRMSYLEVLSFFNHGAALAFQALKRHYCFFPELYSQNAIQSIFSPRKIDGQWFLIADKPDISILTSV